MAVAASGQWRDPDDAVRVPAGEVHAWDPGRNSTRCGVQLSRAGLHRFPHVSWDDVQPATGRYADAVASVCPRCAAASGARRGARSWTRVDPRP